MVLSIHGWWWRVVPHNFGTTFPPIISKIILSVNANKVKREHKIVFKTLLYCDRWCCLLKLNHCSKYKYEASCDKASSFKLGMPLPPYAQEWLESPFTCLHWNSLITIVLRVFSDIHLTFVWCENIIGIFSSHLCFCH